MTETPARPGLLLIICGPSGVGKQTILSGLADKWHFRFAVSATTRPPRPGEKNGVDYHFLERDEFDSWVAEERFLEWERYDGHRYGTPASEVDRHLAQGENVVLDVEAKGARRIMRLRPEAVAVFLEPPSPEELENRLRGRGDMTGEVIASRMAAAAEQMAIGREMPHQVTNRRVDDAVDEILAILEETDGGRQRRDNDRTPH